jgi:hypothetical protein
MDQIYVHHKGKRIWEKDFICTAVKAKEDKSKEKVKIPEKTAKIQILKKNATFCRKQQL